MDTISFLLVLTVFGPLARLGAYPFSLLEWGYGQEYIAVSRIYLWLRSRAHGS
jgi:hypothetical protein